MREVADGVFEIPVMFVNVYMVITDDGVVLVDTGLPGRSRPLREALHEARRQVGDVHTILLTHWHPDHIGTAAELKRECGARLIAHHADADLIAGRQPLPPPRGIQRIGALVMGTVETVGLDHELTADGPTPVPGFSAFHTPGHTAGHVSYLLDRGGGVLFAGDAAMGGRRRLGVSRMAAVDMVAAKASIARLARLDFSVAVFGHGPAVTDRAVDRFRDLATRA